MSLPSIAGFLFRTSFRRIRIHGPSRNRRAVFLIRQVIKSVNMNYVKKGVEFFLARFPNVTIEMVLI